MKYIKTFEQYINEDFKSLNEAKLSKEEKEKEKQKKKDEEWQKLFDELEEAEDELEEYSEGNDNFVAKFKKIYKADDSEVSEISREILSKAGKKMEEMYDKAKKLEEKAKSVEDKAEAKRIMAEAKLFELYGDAFHSMRKYQIQGVIRAVKSITAHIKANADDLEDDSNRSIQFKK